MEERIRIVTQKVMRDLRTFSSEIPHVLPIIASKLSASDRAELSGLAEAPDFFPGVADLVRRIGGAGIGDFVPPGTDLSDIHRIWKDGVDASAR